ncbi:MAG: P-II family nitrogen regulator [Thermodesulfovibrionales bacterium]
MKEIKAIIQPFMLSKVEEALCQIPDFPGMTITKVQGFGSEKCKKGIPHRPVEDIVDYVPKVKIEIMVNDDMLDEVVNTIKERAHTGNRGDGKIFIYDVRDAIRIMTGEHGETAV